MSTKKCEKVDEKTKLLLTLDGRLKNVHQNVNYLVEIS